jgi:hypothetical protein
MFLSLRVEDLDNFLDPQLYILEIILLSSFYFFIPKILQGIRIHKRHNGVQKRKKKITKLSACTRWTLSRRVETSFGASFI